MPYFLASAPGLFLVAGDDGGHHGIARVLDAGHEVFLGDPARADHGVADFAAIGTFSERV